MKAATSDGALAAYRGGVLLCAAGVGADGRDWVSKEEYENGGVAAVWKKINID